MNTPYHLLLGLLLVLYSPTCALQPSIHGIVPRRAALLEITTAATLLRFPAVAEAKDNGLPLNTSSSGLRWADARLGTGSPAVMGAPTSVDYTMASTAGRFPQIYTTKDKGAPYRWIMGDSSMIAGLELAIMGDEGQGIPPMLAGGIRRVIIPAEQGYEINRKNGGGICKEGPGPIPPKDDTGGYQRWYQFYCNPRIPYQPDLVFDVKLYGKR